MTRYYVPTHFTDLHMRTGKDICPKWAIVSGAQFLTPRPEYNIQQADVSADNQTRWHPRMKALMDWGHVPADTSLQIYPTRFEGIGPSASVNFGQSTVAAQPPAGSALARNHRLSEIRRPLQKFLGDGDSSLPDPDDEHEHPETYNPGFTIPEHGVYPYQCYIREEPGARCWSHDTSAGPNNNVLTPWIDQSQQSPSWGAAGGVSGASRIYIRNIYQYGHFCAADGVVPHGGWFLYGLFGVSGSSEFQQYDMFWLTPVFYKVHDRYILADRNQPGWVRAYEDIQDYIDVTSPNAWHNPANWIQRTSTEEIPAGQYVLAGGNTLDPAPPGDYWFRLASGSGAPGDGPIGFDTWEWRGEFRLDDTTPGLGYIKSRQFAQVFPLMNLLESRDVKTVSTTGLIDDTEETVNPALFISTRTKTREKKVAEYGL